MSRRPARPLRIAVLCPHFAPDTAPTGEVMTRIVHELAALGHEVDVVTSLPWYRAHAVEAGWEDAGRPARTTAWGSITRVNPFAGRRQAQHRSPRRRVRRLQRTRRLGLRCAAAASTRVHGDVAAVHDGPHRLGHASGPPGPLVFNIQDVFPDAAVATGAITQQAGSSPWPSGSERSATTAPQRSRCSARTCATTSSRRCRPSTAATVRVIPNFVDTDAIRPLDR